MPVNMSFGLISAHKLPSSTALLNSFVLFQKELSTVVLEVKALEACAWDGWPPSLARCSLGTPFTLSIPLSLTEKTQWQQGDLACGVCGSRNYLCTAHSCASNVLTSSLITQNVMAAVRPGINLGLPAASNTCEALLQDLKGREIGLFCPINEEINPAFDTTLII